MEPTAAFSSTLSVSETRKDKNIGSDLVISRPSGTFDYSWQIEKLSSWHLELVTDTQRETWTAFAILVFIIIFSYFYQPWVPKRSICIEPTLFCLSDILLLKRVLVLKRVLLFSLTFSPFCKKSPCSAKALLLREKMIPWTISFAIVPTMSFLIKFSDLFFGWSNSKKKNFWKFSMFPLSPAD